MRRLLIVAGALAVFATACAADISTIWGVWNLGPESEARFNAEISLGKYLRTGNFLKMEPNSGGQRIIQYEGGYYVIKDIKERSDGFLFILTCRTEVKTAKGNWEEKTVGGLVAMHFIHKDRVWFEVVDDPATDPLFPRGPQGDFPGRSKEYWRAQKVK